MSLGPLDPLGQDSPVRSGFRQVGNPLEIPIDALEVRLVRGGPVADHHLRRVLVRHHDCRRGQLAALRVGVVRRQGLAKHADVVDLLLPVDRSTHIKSQKLFTWTSWPSQTIS